MTPEQKLARLQLVTKAVRIAESAMPIRRVWVCLDTGHVLEVRYAKRDGKSRRDGAEVRKGVLHVPENATHCCVEGDPIWQRLPHHVTTGEIKEREVKARKVAAAAKAAVESKKPKPLFAETAR